MKYILKTAICVAVLTVAASALTACSPNDDTTQSTTTTVAETTTAALTTTTGHGVMSATDVIVRSGPGLDFEAIGGITYDEEVIILGREGDWYRIQFGDQVGYINAQYVDVDDAPNASDMVEALKSTTTQARTEAPTTTTEKGTTVTDKDDNVVTTTKKGTTVTDKDGNVVTTTTKKGTTVTDKDGNVVTTTTTKNGSNATTTTKSGATHGQDADEGTTNVVTTTTLEEGIPIVEGIPEEVIIDDF